ncbi:MAG: deoxynucleoside kinase [Myxococcales bacterium]|nr:deoxynucleoside kinase [Myxococcales bacterium]MCB9646616.1 deoxynucleoside kinase [Deltaproteobacteria bacterium]
MAGEGSFRHRYVVVEGVIGVGKTTLVHQLARALGGRTVLEEFEENPFLPDFYRDRRAYALSTQLFFLMSRFRQQEVLAQGDLFMRRTVSDYLFDKDRIFAQLTLESHELAIYEQLFEVLRPQVATPDLVIFLRADHDTVMRRIAARGRSYELDMDPAYIAELADAYVDYFATYDGAPLLTIDTTRVDFRGRSHALDEVLRAVTTGQVPRVLDAELRSAGQQPSLPGL